MSTSRLIPIILLSLAPFMLVQAQYSPVADIPFRVDGQLRPFALAGGVEAPQFAHFHLDLDGVADLLVFDRVGSKLMLFLAVQGFTGIDYEYAPQYNVIFPELYQLMELKDLNCDGLDDLVTTRRLGVSAAEVTLVVHLQKESGGFEEGVDVQLQGSGDTLLRTHAFDRPALDDIDGDGLVDLLYIPLGGTKIQYYKNISDQVGGCGEMVFTLEDDCWGLASYTLTADFELQSCEPGLAPELGCAGSVMLADDYDMDGDKDLYFSGLYDHEILRLDNGGTDTFSNLISQEIDWLNEGEPMLVFPSPFFLDLYEDGQADLLVAGNGIGGLGNSPESDLLYRFTEATDGSWQFQSSNYWIRDMLDFGFRSSPAIWDVNQDGLPDLLLAFNQPHPTFSHTARMAYFKNTGTADAPEFELESMDFAGLSVYNYKSIHPTFGDLNNDGLPELVIGMENGRMEVFTNIQAGTDQYIPFAYAPLSTHILNGFVKPQLVDLTKDGRLDIVAGTRNGTLSFLENTGTPTMPEFERVTDTLANISPEAYFQESSVYLQPAENGRFDLYYGRRDGTIALYNGNLEEGFSLTSEELGHLDVGERIALCLHDLNSDGHPELIAGNMRGGVEVFEPEVVVSAEPPLDEPLEVQVFPNPFVRGFNMKMSGRTQPRDMVLKMYDTLGQLVQEKRLSGNQQFVEGGDLSSGLYFYVVERQGSVIAQGKVVKR